MKSNIYKVSTVVLKLFAEMVRLHCYCSIICPKDGIFLLLFCIQRLFFCHSFIGNALTAESLHVVSCVLSVVQLLYISKLVFLLFYYRECPDSRVSPCGQLCVECGTVTVAVCGIHSTGF